VPVSSDLTAVYFVNARKGWAVGHDGVILATVDGGATWSLQLDGTRANQALVEDLARKPAASHLLAEANRNVAQGADKPFLDVWFADRDNGFAVGAYNLAFRTANGGETWEPWFDRIDNPRFYNLYSIRPAGGDVWIAGEGGLLLRLDAAAGRFRAVRTPYEGSFFGVTGNASRVVAYGLRGNVYASGDRGASWERVNAGLQAAVVAATALNGELVLADAGGRLTASSDEGRSFARVPLPNPVPLAGLADAGGRRLALAGPRGVFVTPAVAR
jgi:photosystem II stability/assembly factor-like uncharacterized protein